MDRCIHCPESMFPQRGQSPEDVRKRIDEVTEMGWSMKMACLVVKAEGASYTVIAEAVDRPTQRISSYVSQIRRSKYGRYVLDLIESGHGLDEAPEDYTKRLAKDLHTRYATAPESGGGDRGQHRR